MNLFIPLWHIIVNSSIHSFITAYQIDTPTVYFPSIILRVCSTLLLSLMLLAISAFHCCVAHNNSKFNGSFIHNYFLHSNTYLPFPRQNLACLVNITVQPYASSHISFLSRCMTQNFIGSFIHYYLIDSNTYHLFPTYNLVCLFKLLLSLLCFQPYQLFYQSVAHKTSLIDSFITKCQIATSTFCFPDRIQHVCSTLLLSQMLIVISVFLITMCHITVTSLID